MERIWGTIAVLALLATGCGQGTQQTGSSAEGAPNLKVYQAKYALPDEPDGAIGVLAAREGSKTDDSIVVVGFVGGSATPWVDGRAAFVLADASTLTEDAGHCDEACTKPCCGHLKELAGFTALVKCVDGQGRTVAIDARELFGINQRDMVVVRGRALRDDGGNLTILADGVYVRR